MTKNYALFLLNQLCVGASVDAKPIIPQFELAQALSVAIKTLEQQPCEDCISRQAVLDGLASIAKAKARSDAQKSLMGRVIFFTEQLLSVTPTRPTGKWIEKEDYNLDTYYECSECGADYCIEGDILIHKYCPNCGARMTESEEEE